MTTTPSIPFQKYSWLLAILLLLALTWVMFADVLCAPSNFVLSSAAGDIEKEFLHSRQFGFGELLHGNLALWNPYIYSGTPYLAGFQSALLYPLNILFLILPVCPAINLCIALHVFLLGCFTYLWTARRGLHPLACFVSAALMMFGGTYFPHIHAGHLSNLCTMAWAPLIFLSVDELLKKRSLGWLLLGVFAVSMQILAGHPQYVFYTALAAAVYAAFCLIRAPQRPVLTLWLAGIYAGAAALCAVQLLPGIQAAGESLRSAGVSLGYASLFSFPPENLITLAAPDFFGDYFNFPYWGRCYLWEMSLFFSVTGFLLALYGAIAGGRSVRRYSLAMVVILLVLALGSNTWIFRFLYAWVPGFDKFRGVSKFTFQASLFGVMLTGIGLDLLIRSEKVSWKTILAATGTGGLLYAGSLFLQSSCTAVPSGLWNKLMHAIYASGEFYFPAKAYFDPDFTSAAAIFSAQSLSKAAIPCFLFAVFLFFRKFSRIAVAGIAFLCLLEIFLFAQNSLTAIDIHTPRHPSAEIPAPGLQPEERILCRTNPNSFMTTNISNVWGFDPGLLKRYAEFLAFTQGENPETVDPYLPLKQNHRLFGMLRCRWVFFREGDRLRPEAVPVVLPQLLLLHEYQVARGRDQIFASMQDPAFDPRKTLLLESAPEPIPAPNAQGGTARVCDSSTDHLTIEVDTPSPAILLITDVYSTGWRVRDLSQSHAQKKYEILPANYILRAVPLAKGHHRFRMEYLPAAFQIGKWVSIASLLLYIGLVLWWWRRRSITNTRRPIV